VLSAERSHPYSNMSAEDYNAEPDELTGLTVHPGYVDGEAVTIPNTGKCARDQRLFTSTVSGPTHMLTDDNDSGFIDLCQCDCAWCNERLSSMTNTDQFSAKRKPIPPRGGSRDVRDVSTLTDVPTRPPMFDAIGAEKLGVEVSCPSEAGPQDAEVSCPSEASPQDAEMSCPSEASPQDAEMSCPSEASSQDVRPVLSTADAMALNLVTTTTDAMVLNQVTTTADAMPLGEVTGTVDSVATNLILCDGSEVARSQLVNDSELSIQQNRFAFSNWLEWRPQTRGESTVCFWAG
jgi:hypothetical protein